MNRVEFPFLHSVFEGSYILLETDIIKFQEVLQRKIVDEGTEGFRRIDEKDLPSIG